VAARLRAVILVHAEQVGCTCGSREWLAAEQLRNVEHDTEEGASDEYDDDQDPPEGGRKGD
jgi:hypothetical protein